MWKPLLVFLKGLFYYCIVAPTGVLKYIPELPTAWELEAASIEQEEAEDESGSDDEDEATLKEPKTPKAPAAPQLSKSYPEFLQFLELGCNGSPLQGYPAVLVILSTIPCAVSFAKLFHSSRRADEVV